ncbi:MAG: stage 0 sporulation family protein [Clostridia bacterium]|nr:stage 0 sporulation family protein [Clostridia bacterium]
MVTVVGVRFKKAGKIYYFDPDEIETLNQGTKVIVQTARGVEYGEVVIGPKQVDEQEVVAPLKKVIRIATPEDQKVNEENQNKEKEAFDICLKKIEKHGLDMKLVDVEYTFDNNKVIFYFTADGRVDFRDLVKDLASVFRTRIELRQIGVRDEAKMMGGLGACGRQLCCSVFLGDFEPVSIKMAKEQNLSLNPAKISGICGRLMCCLRYEHEIYEKMIDKLPNMGAIVNTPNGPGIVVGTSVIKENVSVKVMGDNNIAEIKEFSIPDVRTLHKECPGYQKAQNIIKELEE